jgi:hypothetical protein
MVRWFRRKAEKGRQEQAELREQLVGRCSHRPATRARAPDGRSSVLGDHRETQRGTDQQEKITDADRPDSRTEKSCA